MPELGRFLSVGMVNMGVGLLVIYACKWFLQAGDVPANATGYAFGLCSSFALNSRWTFAYRGPQLPAIAKFLAVAAAAYAVNLATVLVAIHYLGLNDYLAQALGIPPYTLATYLAGKFFVFRRPPAMGSIKSSVFKGWPGKRTARGTGLMRLFSFWPLQIGGWVLMFLVPVLFLMSGSILDPSILCYSFARPLNGFLITLALRPGCSWALTRFGKRWLLVPAILLVSAVVSFMELMAVDRLVLAFGFPAVTKETWTAIFFMRMTIFTIWLLLYFGIKSIKLHAATEREFQQSELKLLRSQVNPHFLFNALATIMAVRKDEEMVSRVTQSLADYLRFSLAQESPDQDQFKHPLGQELSALENYLLVERVRFQENLQTRIEVSEEARAAYVPSALVQPLLENAIKYGQMTSPPPLCIAIEARLSAGRLLLMVENTGRWVEPQDSASTGLGITNLRKRLQLLYADQAQLSLDRTATAVRAHLSIPVSASA